MVGILEKGKAGDEIGIAPHAGCSDGNLDIRVA